LGDEFGNIHILTIHSNGMEMETLGSCVISSSLAHIHDGLVYVGSQFGDPQLIQIHQEAVTTTTTTTSSDELDASTTFLEIVEEYTNLGPITDFDLVPTHAQQSQVVTCSGSSTSGSIRLIRNGIGMSDCASVEMEGIQNLWSIRSEWSSAEDAYLVQSFVGETRVLGVSTSAMDQDEDDDDDGGGGTLEEVVLEGLDSTASSLYVGNVQVGNSILQITESELRLMSASAMQVTATWSPEGGQSITVASANEAGQIVVSLRGGVLLYLRVVDASTIELIAKTTLEREVSCLDLHPFVVADGSAMVVDMAPSSDLVAVGLWDDFSVRLLSLDADLKEVLHASLGMEDDDEADATDGVARRTRNHMMARSLCLITLDSANTVSSSGSVNMLFVGLGDGTLISFAVLERDGHVGVHSKKEVSLGTQRINLVPLQTEQGGRCVLATGDRPTVIYLAGGVCGTAASFSNPKLCYSNVNLSASDTGDDDDDVNRPPAQQSIAVNVATPFVSPRLFDTTSVGSKHFSLCVSDDSNLRLGIIDDIQKLHVTTCRLGMAPRRVVHCSQDRMFAVGCIESGLTQGDSARDDVNMGNCIRFLDDTTFDDIER
jgi:DNA damage-binding protein 1